MTKNYLYEVRTINLYHSSSNVIHLTGNTIEFKNFIQVKFIWKYVEKNVTDYQQELSM